MTNETKPPARRGRPPGSTAEKTRLKRLELERIKSLKKRRKAIKKAIKTPKTPVQLERPSEPAATPQQPITALNQANEVCITPVETATVPDPDTVGPTTGAATDAADSTASIPPPSTPVHPFGHGGARPNSGRRGKEYESSGAALDFDDARTRNETAKAGLNEMELKIKTGEYIARAAVQTASATALATMAQTMRSIPDNMERKGIAPEVCVMVERIIDEVMAGLSLELEMLGSDSFNG